jgi:hypothetical protein
MRKIEIKAMHCRAAFMVKSGHRFLEDLVMFATQLKSFFWVARLGSITQAARQLG